MIKHLQFSESLINNESGYLLIDPGNYRHGPRLKDFDKVSCAPRQLHHRAELLPQLIDLAQLGPADQDYILDLLCKDSVSRRPALICARIQTSVDIHALAEAISENLIQRKDGASVYWRYFDPRVLVQCATVLSGEQMAALLAPATEWDFPWQGGSGRISPPPHENADHAAPLPPDAGQWARIERSTLVTQILAGLQAEQVLTHARQVLAQLDTYLEEQNQATQPVPEGELILCARKMLEESL